MTAPRARQANRDPAPELPPGGGLLLVDKPAGCTSHDVVGRLRRVLGTRRVGHAGTLDPMATGLLVVAVERSTKLLGHLALTDKTYQATIRLGASTTTDDAEGEIVATADWEDLAAISDAAIDTGIAALTGPILQVPSSVSAIKVDGKRAYALVRAGEQVELAARPVTVTRFDVDERRRGDGHIDLDVQVECTTGTYVRSLARDLGNALRVGGHLTALRRTTVGPFDVTSAIDVYGPRGVPERGDRIEITPEFSAGVAAAVIPATDAVRGAFAVRTVDDDLAADMRYGRPVPAAGLPGVYGLFGPGGLLALVEESDGLARPRLVWDPAG